jgi:hypothetical protein
MKLKEVYLGLVLIVQQLGGEEHFEGVYSSK